MAHGTVALVLTALLTVSVLLVSAPTPASAASPAAAPAPAPLAQTHPAAAPGLEVFNGYGYYTTSFYIGEVGWDKLYFAVSDTVDLAVNVTITDLNATRDGVTSPAFHYKATLNTTTHIFESWLTGVSYVFPSTIPYGGTWTINVSGPVAGYTVENLHLYDYYTELSTSVGSSATLPTEPISVFWSLYLQSNGASLYTKATNVWITGHYTGNGTVQNFFAGGRVALPDPAAGQGEWTGVVPANTTADTQIDFEVYAVTNVSGEVAENESANITVDVGALALWGVSITYNPGCYDYIDYDFATGTTIGACIIAGADYEDSQTPISGLPVTVAYWNGTAHVTPTGGAPTALTTGASGEAAFTFLASSPPFIQEFQYPGYDALNFTVSLPGAYSTGGHWTVWSNDTWRLYGYSNSEGVVQVTLDHTSYYAGATATAMWSINTTDLANTGPITADNWFVTGPHGIVYDQGVFTGTAQSGTFTFPITAAMVPNEIEVTVYASNATDQFDGETYAYVLGPSLLLSPGSSYYTAGSTATVQAVLFGGSTVVGATINYQVWGDWQDEYAEIGSGTVANGSSISIPISSSTPPLYLEVEGWATADGQVIATNDVYLDLAYGYSIILSVETVSSYSDGSFQPGETVTLGYEVVATGGAALPQTFSFVLEAFGLPYYAQIENVPASGTIPFTIPSDAKAGTLVLELSASGSTLTAGTCFPTGNCAGITSLLVNPSPSVFNMELGSGSGITVGWLILLILVIVVALVLYVVLRRRGGATGSTMGPPAPAPTTPPATEWKEPPTPVDQSPPPMPTPPPGPS